MYALETAGQAFFEARAQPDFFFKLETRTFLKPEPYPIKI